MPDTPAGTGAPASISRDEVAHLADLARIDLSDAELDHLAPQLSVILESVASINDVAVRRHPADLARPAADQRLPRRRGPARADGRGGAERCARGGAAAVQGAADPRGRAVTGEGADARPALRASADASGRLGRDHQRRGHPGAPRPDRRGRRMRCTRSCRSTPRARSAPRRPPTNAARPGRRRARWTAYRSRSRTSWRPAGCPRPAVRGSWRAGSRRTTRPSSRGCARPACRSSARPTWTSSRWAPPPSTAPTVRPTTRGTSAASPAAPAAAARPRSRRTRPRWRSAPTPAARSASPAPSPARSA